MALTTANEQSQLYSVVAGSSILSAQLAAIGSTVLVANAPAGIYRFNVVLERTVAGTSGNLVINAIYTDDITSQTTAVITVADISVAASSTSASLLLENTAAANISFSTTLSGTAGALSYNLYIVLERLF